MAKQCAWYTEIPRYEQCIEAAVPGTSRCEEHKIEKRKRKENLTTEAKNAFRKRMGNVCAECNEAAYEVDHIVELNEFPDDEKWKADLPSNLQLLCYEHHLKKTNRYRKEQIVLSDPNDYSTSARNRKKKRRRKMGYWI